MRSNPYVYPYTPFHDLSEPDKKATFTEKNISTEELKALVAQLPKLDFASFEGTSVAEKIFNIFISESVLFGPREYLETNKEKWLEQFNYFIDQEKPLQFTILGFPFKMPVPLKTNRTLPDMGEVLSLKRLHELTQVIQKVYAPGAVVVVVTEGVFGRFNKMDRTEYDAYKDLLQKIIDAFGWNTSLVVKELEEMEKLDTNFEARFEKKVAEFEELHKNNDEAFMKKYEGAKESILRIINVRDLNLPEEVLIEVYNDNLSDEQISAKAREIRQYIQEQAHYTLIRYHAYLTVRDDLNYIETAVPHALTLSVSPKPNRLGIIPVNEECVRLPYHGVPVYHPAKNQFTIEYLIDIERMSQAFEKVYWQEDGEKVPFYYTDLG